MDDHADHDNYTFIMSPTDAMWRGLQYCGIELGQQKDMTLDKMVTEFKAHYGSSPLVVANIWSDLCSTTTEGARLKEEEKLEKGFKKFMQGIVIFEPGLSLEARYLLSWRTERNAFR
jgi:hypothetical protein